ncbi:hypothetical protein [Deinococcus soli (ex Cha et al. 2016)]|uniref:Uncharacterized protein n=2 Tax=Deinococcus soli (ex Cha et al. 2016) TaxID=1309411 RepID=A0AAE3XCH2_9DEIO|nr:hypothetical protein [Deinococcus soli (ex Cha et al. 2016)]MDR6218384.1 hypothetical protein [Deinococcus soli (ex Cha et al. 2016)]MDR6329124.1 hypothetical protein [Deinococcus soli (ex Cha et al. 2016)]MDR6751397.1 hypothetical protein [Deinococcus soli (ex Cha et al. 2016)]
MTTRQNPARKTPHGLTADRSGRTHTNHASKDLSRHGPAALQLIRSRLNAQAHPSRKFLTDGIDLFLQVAAEQAKGHSPAASLTLIDQAATRMHEQVLSTVRVGVEAATDALWDNALVQARATIEAEAQAAAPSTDAQLEMEMLHRGMEQAQQDAAEANRALRAAEATIAALRRDIDQQQRANQTKEKSFKALSDDRQQALTRLREVTFELNDLKRAAPAPTPVTGDTHLEITQPLEALSLRKYLVQCGVFAEWNGQTRTLHVKADAETTARLRAQWTQDVTDHKAFLRAN